MQPGVGHPDPAGNGFGHVPRAFATLCVAEGLSAWNADRQEIPNPRADEPPAFPEAHPQTPPNLLVEVLEKSHLLRQREVPRSAARRVFVKIRKSSA